MCSNLGDLFTCMRSPSDTDLTSSTHKRQSWDEYRPETPIKCKRRRPKQRKQSKDQRKEKHPLAAAQAATAADAAPASAAPSATPSAEPSLSEFCTHESSVYGSCTYSPSGYGNTIVRTLTNDMHTSYEAMDRFDDIFGTDTSSDDEDMASTSGTSNASTLKKSTVPTSTLTTFPRRSSTSSIPNRSVPDCA